MRDSLLSQLTSDALREIASDVAHDADPFQAALAAGPGSPERDRYVFRPGRGADGELPGDWRFRIDATDVIAAFSDDLIDKRDQRIKQREYAKLEAAIVGPNRIEVRTKHIQRYSLFLNDRLIDTAKPVSIWTNGQLSYEGPVTVSIDMLLRQARLRHDPRQLFPIHLPVLVPKQAS